MGKITAAEPAKRNKNRVNVYIDGEFAFSMDALVAKKYHIEAGAEADEAMLKRAAYESDLAAAFDRAAAFISYRNRTVREVERKLREKGYSPSVTEATINKLKTYGMLGDENFCRNYAEYYGKSRSKRAIAAELKRLGADETAAREALETLNDQNETALSAARKYAAVKRAPDKTKLKQFLFRKGFAFSEIDYAVTMLDGEGTFAEPSETEPGDFPSVDSDFSQDFSESEETGEEDEEEEMSDEEREAAREERIEETIKTIRRYARTHDPVDKYKLRGYLYRKGISGEVSAEAVRRFFEEGEDE